MRKYEFLTIVFILISVVLANAQNEEFFTHEFLVLNYQKNKIHTVDFNNDALSDIAIALNTSDGIMLLLNGPQGFINEPAFISNGGYATNSLSSGDMNGDGNSDLAVGPIGTWLNQVMKVLLGNGNAGTTGQNYWQINGVPNYILLGNLDGDGFDDVAAFYNWAGLNLIEIAQTSQSLQAFTYTTGGQANSMSISDFNNDGLEDIIVLHQSANKASIHFGGSVSSYSNVPLSNSPSRLVCDDFNNDDNYDLLLSSYQNNSINLFQGNGNGTFSNNSEIILSDSPISIVSSDFNIDGYCDFIVGYNNNGLLGLYAGDGNGNFELLSEDSVTITPSYLEVGYFKNQDVPDLILGNSNSDSVMILYNNIPCLNPQLDTIIPNNGANSTSIPVKIRGRGFSEDCQVKLSKTGEDDIIVPDSSIQVKNCFEILSLFDLKGQTTGLWDLTVTNPGDTVMTIQNGFEIIRPHFDDFSPKNMGNTGQVTMGFYGLGFTEETFFLITNGMDTIQQNDSIIYLINNTRFNSVLNLSNVSNGIYDVIVEIPDDTVMVILDSLIIDDVNELLWVDLVGPNQLLVGQPKTITINYGNFGNIDASNVWLAIGIPLDFSFEIDLPDALPPPITPSIVPPGDDIIQVILLDIPDIDPGESDYLSLEITAESIGIYDLYLDLSTDADPYFYSLLTLPDSIPPFNNPQINIMQGPFKDDWPQIDISMSPPPGYVMIWKEPTYSWGQCHYHIAKSIGNGQYIEMLRNDNGPDLQISTLGNSFGENGYLGALRPPEYDEAHGQLIIDRANNLIDLFGTDEQSEWVRGLCKNNAADNILRTNCLGVFHILNPEFRSYGLKYWRKIYDVLAFPLRRWYSPSEKNIYKFFGYFSNNSTNSCFQGYEKITSNLVAQINAVNSLDPNDKVGPVGYGSLGYVLPYIPFYYIIHFENIDTATAAASTIIIADTLNPNLNWTTLVFDTASHIPTSQTIDMTTGIVEWVFEDINLPPNVTPPEGEGWVMFHVDQNPDLPSGTQITNRASIKFDYNDPILTGTILNTIDDGYPSSSMNTFTTHLDSTKYLISWSGQDDYLGSGIRDYSIYYSEHPDSAYIEWLRYVEDTSAIFTGEYEKTYYFYSIAQDGVGYIESSPDSYDLALFINLGVEENDLLNPNFLRIYPNPFSDKTTIEFSNPNQSVYNLSVFSITGEKVMEIKNIINNKVEINKNTLAKGIYYIELKGEQIFNNKMIIIK